MDKEFIRYYKNGRDGNDSEEEEEDVQYCKDKNVVCKIMN